MDTRIYTIIIIMMIDEMEPRRKYLAIVNSLTSLYKILAC
jgi:hypothetical protein